MRSLYVHVPFCPTICPYCDFHVLRRHGGVVGAYLEHLKDEAHQLHGHFSEPLNTLYFGGGTPSFLRNAELVRLFSALPWKLEASAEVTMEVNPGTLNPERVQLLKDLGVNRVSIGVQSFQDGVLKELGRAHGRRGALQAIELCLEAGLRASVDLILGLPGQNFRADLRQAVGLGVEHLSAYMLQIEPGTPYAIRGLQPNPDSEAQAFEQAEEILGEAGLLRYEVSNFARPGQESRHNLAYWRTEFWGALGPSAAGHLPAMAGAKAFSYRSTNPPLPRWLAAEPVPTEAISPSEHLKEALMMGLRIREGVDLETLEIRTGIQVRQRLQPALARLAAQGLIKTTRSNIVSTPTGLPLLNRTIMKLWEALEE